MHAHHVFPPSSPSPPSAFTYLDDKMAKWRADSRHLHIERAQVIDEKHAGQDRCLVVVCVAVPF
jgi:hypothetical protein